MSRPYLCMDVSQRWLWMGGDPWRIYGSPLITDVERECRDAWEEAADRFKFNELAFKPIHYPVHIRGSALMDALADMERLLSS